MGYILSSSTVTLDVHLSPLGRYNLLKSGSTIFKYFGLGDSDSNYLSSVSLTNGFVPDVSGDHIDCILSMHEGVNIKHNIFKNEVTQDTINSFDSQVVMFFNDCSNLVYYNEAEVDIYFHDYIAMLKGLTAFKSYKHKPNGWTTLSANSEYTVYVSGTTEEKLYYELENLGRGTFLDIYDFVKIKKSNVFNDDNFTIKLDPLSLKLFKDLSSALFVDKNTSGYENKTKIDTFVSPLVFSFNSRNTNNISYRGAGPFGVSLNVFDLGYMVVDDSPFQSGIKTDIYPEFVKTTSNQGFYSAYEIETQSFNDINLQTNIIPSARIITKDKTYYYPLNRRELNSQNSILKSSSGITKTTTGLETYVQFTSGVEYIYNGYEIKPNTDFNDEPFTLLTRQIDMLEQTFDAFVRYTKFGSIDYSYLKNTNLVQSFSGVSGETISISMNLEIDSVNNVNAKPAKLKVNFIYSKNALRRSLVRNPSTGQYYIYKSSSPKLFGENYNIGTSPTNLDFTTQLNDFYTRNNNKIYKKITGLL